MTKEHLRDSIMQYFEKDSDFIKSFNAWCGGTFLEATKLSKQLSGTIKISIGWAAAYSSFFKNKT